MHHSRSIRLLVLPALLLPLACGEGERGTLALAGNGEYVGQAEVLRGLDRIRVNPSFMDVSESGIAIPADLRDRVEQRLMAAGLQMLTEEELEAQPGLPEMQIYPSAGGDGAAGMDKKASCCTANVWISVLEGTALDRDPDLRRRLPVWGAGSHDSCAAGPADAGDLVLALVDRFIADLRQANTAEVADGSEPSRVVAGGSGS